ncbi:MAG: O-acetyl-ADP-ribose deacetylase [Oscillospiraceae bacterium]|nr:O-acetyl-ADP-ribose deacetylase [Oscillospiraceae bacterium]
MPFHIIRADITTLKVDAIVNAANPSLLGGGGVDGAIHRAAGPALREYCAGLGGCQVGQAKRSPGFALPAKWVIHTVGPVWCGGSRNEEALLSACYRNSLALALEAGCGSVAFPLISAGAYGYPKDQALQIAVREIGAFLLRHEMEVTLCVYDRTSFRLSGRLFAEVQSYLDRWLPEPDRSREPGRQWALDSMAAQASPAPPSPPYAAAKPSGAQAPASAKQRKKSLFPLPGKKKDARQGAQAAVSPQAAPPAPAEQEALFDAACAYAEAARPAELDQRLRCLDESFSQMLLRKIDEKGMTDAACYKRANVDRKLFSKIRSDPGYRPSKPTAIAFAIALELPLPEARELLMKAGFALSHSNKFDIIIEYFIANGRYDIFEINETLFAFDQSLLGA